MAIWTRAHRDARRLAEQFADDLSACFDEGLPHFLSTRLPVVVIEADALFDFENASTPITRHVDVKVHARQGHGYDLVPDDALLDAAAEALAVLVGEGLGDFGTVVSAELIECREIERAHVLSARLAVESEATPSGPLAALLLPSLVA